MKSYQLPYPLKYDVSLRWLLALADRSVCPVVCRTSPDSFYRSPWEPNSPNFGQPKCQLLASAGREKSSVTTPRSRPPHVMGRQGEAFRSPSSPEEDPSKTNSMEKGYEPDCNKYVSVIILRDKPSIFTNVLFYLRLGGGLSPLRALRGKDAP